MEPANAQVPQDNLALQQFSGRLIKCLVKYKTPFDRILDRELRGDCHIGLMKSYINSSF